MQAEQSRCQDTVADFPFQIKPFNLSYWGMEGERNAYKDVELETFVVSKEITDIALGDANTAFQTEPIDLFLSVIAHSFARVFSDRKAPTIFNEGHGREPWEAGPDPSRTVGWFTTICPIHIPVDSGKSHSNTQTFTTTGPSSSLTPQFSFGWKGRCFVYAPPDKRYQAQHSRQRTVGLCQKIPFFQPGTPQIQSELSHGNHLQLSWPHAATRSR